MEPNIKVNSKRIEDQNRQRKYNLALFRKMMDEALRYHSFLPPRQSKAEKNFKLSKENFKNKVSRRNKVSKKDFFKV
jgi:hypothetical protein